ncbi:MAG: HEAT repeat domain-containing protein [Candidatus Riflebacteria bacterium]|nr:HEAT repeat domain-containing protein [Candidatus Riflebacteria bacterium]
MDLNHEIIQTLDAPIKSFRIFALERAIQEGSSAELLEILRKRQFEEKDEECLILLSHAVAAVKNRISLTTNSDYTGLSNENFLTTFSSFLPEEKFDLLNRLSHSQVKELAIHAPKLISKETNPVVLANLVRKFSPHWSEENLQLLKQILRSKFLSVRLSALETLISINAESLINELPQLLSSTDPRVRSLAIKGLSRIDMDCAIEHLEIMLMGSNNNEKICALQNCFALPFEKIKLLLIKFLASEMSPALLEKAGLLLQINADQEIPYRLLEFISHAPLPRLEILKKIYSGSCDAIEKSGILGNGFQAYRERLKDFEKKSVFSKDVNGLLSKLFSLSSDQDFDEEFSRLSDSDNPELLIASKELFQLDLSPKLKEKLANLINSIEKRSASEKSLKKPLSLEGLSETEIIRTFASWPSEDREKIEPFIREVISKNGNSVKLQVSAIKAARRLELQGFIKNVELFLKHSEEKITVAAMEYLADFDPDKIFPLMGTYLQSQSIMVKSAAIGIFRRFDPNRALSSLKVLLLGKNPEQRKKAMSCMIQFDFPVIRDLLVDFLFKNSDPELFDLGLCLFKTNPDPENLYYLFRLGKTLQDEFAEKIASTRKYTEKVLIEQGLLENGQIESLNREFSARLITEENKANAFPKPYSIQEVRKHSENNSDSDGNTLSRLITLIYSWISQILLLCELKFGINWKKFMAAGCVILLAMLSFAGRIFQTSVPNSNKPRALVRTEKQIVAKVEKIEKEYGGILIKSNDGTKYLLLAPANSNFKLSQGDEVKVSLTPFRLNDQGVYIVQIFQLEKIPPIYKKNNDTYKY